MEEYRRCQIPAFGNWDFSDSLPITQYFESARQAGLLRYNDLGEDLYGEYLEKPMTRTPISHSKLQEKESSKPYQSIKETKKEIRVCDVKEAQILPRAPKPVDEDLYKIPPELLRKNSRTKSRVVGFFTECITLNCCTA
ncbi:uncharacterized protein LOC143845593 [Tasmannia lanceolata]|uniref:uncharacterized protein LOC143845593 n=1 Tax=Tasmannia lanceolata TaxID=3420 RepID=UPI00406419D0